VSSRRSYGLCFSPDGRRLYASGGEFDVVHAFDFRRGYLSGHEEFTVGKVEEKLIVGGLTIDPRRTLYAAGTWGDVVFTVPTDNPDNPTVFKLDKESFHYFSARTGRETSLRQSLEQGGVAVLDLATGTVSETWTTGIIRPRWPFARRQDALCRLRQFDDGERPRSEDWQGT
jgi:hypothetical protein